MLDILKGRFRNTAPADEKRTTAGYVRGLLYGGKSQPYIKAVYKMLKRDPDFMVDVTPREDPERPSSRSMKKNNRSRVEPDFDSSSSSSSADDEGDELNITQEDIDQASAQLQGCTGRWSVTRLLTAMGKFAAAYRLLLKLVRIISQCKIRYHPGGSVPLNYKAQGPISQALMHSVFQRAIAHHKNALVRACLALPSEVLFLSFLNITS